MDIKTELQLQGVRLSAGLATSDDLRRVADTALNLGLYSPSLAEAALFSENDLIELGPAYKNALKELHINHATEKEEIIWYLLRHYIAEIGQGEIKPSEGVEKLLHDVYYHFDLYDRSVRCIGDSHHIEGILGEYFQLEDFGTDRHAEIEAAILSECMDWLQHNSQPGGGTQTAR
jgi:hypothetical protein